jgi:hypothetical protein
MDEERWLSCSDPRDLLQMLRGRVSERKFRLFACAAWRLRYTRTGPSVLRWTLGRVLLGPLAKVERAADGQQQLREPSWWGTFTFADPQAETAALATIGVFEGVWPTLTWSTERPALCQLLRDLFGNPCRPVVLDPGCLTADVAGLARAAYEDRLLPGGELDPTRLAVLGDALEEAGCNCADLLAHLRISGRHVRGCWAVDHLLGKE